MSPALVAQLQRSAGNRATLSLLDERATTRAEPAAAPAVAVQRGLRKAGAGNQVYANAPVAYMGKRLSPSVREQLSKIIKNDLMHPTTKRHFTMPQALAWAKRRVMAAGRLITVRPGVRFADVRQLRKYIKGRGGNTTLLKTKLVDQAPAYNSVLSQVAVTEDDFKKVSFTGAASTVHSVFCRTFAQALPPLVRTSSAFNEICTAAAQTKTPGFSSVKGSWFEEWCRNHVLAGMKRVTIVKKGTMSCTRTCDAYDPGTGTLWDMKNYPGAMSVGTSDYQARDYRTILDKGYHAADGSVILAVAYIFPTQAAAQANAWLSAAPYKFAVYYPGSGQPPALVKQS